MSAQLTHVPTSSSSFTTQQSSGSYQRLGTCGPPTSLPAFRANSGPPLHASHGHLLAAQYPGNTQPGSQTLMSSPASVSHTARVAAGSKGVEHTPFGTDIASPSSSYPYSSPPFSNPAGGATSAPAYGDVMQRPSPTLPALSYPIYQSAVKQPGSVHGQQQYAALPRSSPLLQGQPGSVHDQQQYAALPRSSPMLHGQAGSVHDQQQHAALPRSSPMLQAQPGSVHEQQQCAALPRSSSMLQGQQMQQHEHQQCSFMSGQAALQQQGYLPGQCTPPPTANSGSFTIPAGSSGRTFEHEEHYPPAALRPMSLDHSMTYSRTESQHQRQQQPMQTMHYGGGSESYRDLAHYRTENTLQQKFELWGSAIGTFFGSCFGSCVGSASEAMKKGA